MALEKKFIKEAIRNRNIEEFLAKQFDRAGYSHSEIQRTPLSIRITIFAQRPGLIIGRGGRNIEDLIEKLKTQFNFENPQLDVQEIPNPDMDASVIAKWIASSIERGLKYKRVAHISVDKVMRAGAVGVGITISGKVSGDMARKEKFSAGYLKYSGEPSETDVDTAYDTAHVKMGTIGIQVRIMKKEPKELEILRYLEDEKEKLDDALDIEDRETEEEAIEDIKPEEPKEEKIEVEKVKEKPKIKKKPVKKEKPKKTKEKKLKTKKTVKKKVKKEDKDGDNKKEGN